MGPNSGFSRVFPSRGRLTLKTSCPITCTERVALYPAERVEFAPKARSNRILHWYALVFCQSGATKIGDGGGSVCRICEGVIKLLSGNARLGVVARLKTSIDRVYAGLNRLA